MKSGVDEGGASALAATPRLDGAPFLELGIGWSLSADRNQWILNKLKRWKGTAKWQPISFVGSDKAVLRRILRKKGLAVPPDASIAVNHFFATDPHKFLQWRDDVEASQRGLLRFCAEARAT